MIHCNTKEIVIWLKKNDVFVVYRGLRDTGEVFEEIGIKMEMPSFTQKGAQQLSTHDSNISSVVAKVNVITAYVVFISVK